MAILIAILLGQNTLDGFEAIRIYRRMQSHIHSTIISTTVDNATDYFNNRSDSMNIKSDNPYDNANCRVSCGNAINRVASSSIAS